MLTTLIRNPVRIAPRLEPVLVNDPKMLERIYQLRVEAWKTEGVQVTDDTAHGWHDAHDEEALHWAILDGRDLLASARLTVHYDFCDISDSEYFTVCKPSVIIPVAVLGRLVVAPEARGLGLSTRLDAVRLKEAARLNCGSVAVVTTNPRRILSLSKLGFHTLGEADIQRGNAVRHGVLMTLDPRQVR